ncbi:MAG: FISUMP domain-containing protein [Bacteroidota bacterium]
MNHLSPNLFRTAIFSLACILIVTVSCNKDDGPPPDPCAQTPLLTVAAETEDFAITASASGGEAPYSFQLDDGDFQTSGNFTSLSAKEYTLTVQDANDCINTTKVTVVDPCAEGTLVVEAVSEGTSITATADGGTAPYTFSIDGQTFQEGNLFAELDFGNYTITVKDANDCTDSVTVTVVNPCGDGTLDLDLTVNGFDITATATGGTAPYTYNIDGETFQESNVFNSLEAGNYTITVQDANDCTFNASATVVDPCAEGTLALEASVEGFTITATASGGTAPYTYSLDGETFQENGVFEGLDIDDYTITVKDANNCTQTTNVEVADPCTALSVEATVEEFTITAEASGGKAPYTFSIDGETFQEVNSFDDLELGEYTITVKDANNCTQTINVEVADPCTELAVEATIEVYTITATASGGAEPYTYSLDGETFQESNVFADLETGNYTLTVKDANDCLATVEVTNSCDTSGLEVTVTAELYEIEASGSGGEGPYTFSIDGVTFQNSGVFADLPLQDYTVTIKDAKQCTSTVQVTAEQLESFRDPRDGQTYKVVTIGGVIWMAENLNYQGDGIGFSCPDNDDANCATYGALYNWNEAQLAAPEGWHVPADAEWDALIATLGGPDVAGDAMKANGGSGFNLLFSGRASTFPDYVNAEVFGTICYYWSEELDNQTSANYYFVNVEASSVGKTPLPKNNARFSVRCIKD